MVIRVVMIDQVVLTFRRSG